MEKIKIYKEALKHNWEIFCENKSALVGFYIFLFFGVLAILSFFPPIISDIYHPMVGVDDEIFGSTPPSMRHPLGTDFMGRDILSQLLSGARIAFTVGILSAIIATILGTLIGIISGYYGGILDTLIMRLCDIMFCLPGLPFLIVLSAVVGKLSIFLIIFLIAFFGWPGIARVVRSQTLSLRERPYIESAKVIGASSTRIIIKHLLPNVLPFTFLYIAFGISGAILTEAALSFLGLGDPTVMSWGIMLQWAFTTGHTFKAPYWILPPGICISLLSLAFYLIGRGFDEIINPRLKER